MYLNFLQLVLLLNFILKLFRFNLCLPKIRLLIILIQLVLKPTMAAISLMLLDVLPKNNTTTELVSNALDFAEAAVKSFMVQNLIVWQDLVTTILCILILLKIDTSEMCIVQSLKVLFAGKLQSEVLAS